MSEFNLLVLLGDVMRFSSLRASSRSLSELRSPEGGDGGYFYRYDRPHKSVYPNLINRYDSLKGVLLAGDLEVATAICTLCAKDYQVKCFWFLFSCLTALCAQAQMRALIYVFESVEESPRLIRKLVSKELNSGVKRDKLFRDKSLCGAVIEVRRNQKHWSLAKK